MRCLLPAVLLCLTTLACQKPKADPAPTKIPTLQEPVYRTDTLPKDVTVPDLIVALTLDLKETKAVLKRALGYLQGAQPPESPQAATQTAVECIREARAILEHRRSRLRSQLEDLQHDPRLSARG